MTPSAEAVTTVSSISCKPSAVVDLDQSTAATFLFSLGIPQPTNSSVTIPLLLFELRTNPPLDINCIHHHSKRPRTALYTKSWSLNARSRSDFKSESPSQSRLSCWYSFQSLSFIPRFTAVLGISPDILPITSRFFCGAEESNEITSAITGAPFSPVRVSHFREFFCFTPKKLGKNTGLTLRELRRAPIFLRFTCLIKLLSIYSYELMDYTKRIK